MATVYVERGYNIMEADDQLKNVKHKSDPQIYVT